MGLTTPTGTMNLLTPKTMNDNPNPATSKTQNAQIFAYLKAGNKLTSLVALNKFGCFRLASRISDLRRLHPEEDIRVERVKTIQNKTVAQYYIATL